MHSSISKDEGSILIVRHGPGRGREEQYLTPVLDYFRAHGSDLFARIQLHETGADAPPNLDGVRAILFWLGDPLRELYPDCHAEASMLAEAARERGIHLVNPPDALSNSIKTRQATLWREAGLLTPAHTRFTNRDELLEIAHDHVYPLLVKADQLHVQTGMHLCHSRADVEALRLEDLYLPGAVAEFIDTREGYRISKPNSPWARYFHKKRIIVFGDVLHPRHVFFAKVPIVGLKGSILTEYAKPRKRKKWRHFVPSGVRLALNPDHRACLAEDWAYYQAEPEEPEMMRLASKTLGLDFMGIDYSTLADGRVVLWEANPYFWLPGPQTYILKKERHFDVRFHGFYDAFREFLETLLAAPSTR
jgi:hypothetical protein